MKIEEQILLYSQLPPDERRAVDAYVDEHPEWRPMLDEAKAFEDMLAQARELGVQPPRDEALAFYVTTSYFSHQPPPEPLRRAFEDIEASLDADPERRARYEAFVERLRELTRHSDAMAQFERLTSSTPSIPEESAMPAPDRPAKPSPSKPRRHALVRWSVAVAAVLTFLYAGGWIVSEATQSELDRLAAIAPSELDLDGYSLRTRGVAPAVDEMSPQERHVQALTLIRDARTSVLGLFPGYDQDMLTEAAAQLEAVIAAEEDGSFLQLEAYYFLGKVRLAQKNVSAARDAFRTVVEQQGRQAPEARRLLLEIPE